MKFEKLSRRDFLRLTTLAAGGLVTARCAPSTPSATKAPAATTAPEEVSLSFWNMPFVTQEVSPEYVQEWEKDVKTALPNAAVDDFYGPGKYADQRDKFLLQATSGTPDVIEGLLEDTAVYVAKGLVEPLDDRFAAWEDSQYFVESTLTPLRIGGSLYGIPYNTNARAMVYRKDIFEDHGLQLPQTWSELVETARKITELTNAEVHGFYTCTEVGGPRAAQEFISWYYQVSDREHLFDVAEGDVKFNGTVERFEQVLALYDDLFEEVEYPACDPDQRGTGWPVEDPGYVAGKWAMCPMGPWLWGRRTEGDTAKDILENRTEITSLPVAEGGTPATYLEVKPIMLNAHSNNKDAAWELIKYICSKEKMGEWLADSGGIPAREDSLELEVFSGKLGWWLQGFADELPKAVTMAPVNWGPVKEAYLRAVNYVIYDEQTPSEAAQWLYDEIEGLRTSGEL